MSEKRYRRGVFIVIYKKGKDKVQYLVLKRHKHWRGWEFVKGGCENKERYGKCIIREVKEETGQIPKKIEWYCKQGKYRYNKELEDRQGFIGQTYTLASCEIAKEKIKIDKGEHSSYKWLDFEKALKMLTWPNQRACLKIVNKRIK